MPPKTRAAARKTRRKDRKNVTHGHAYIKSTFNNTIVSLTDPQGAVIAWCSSGQVGFKGSRKSTPYAAQLAAEGARPDVIVVDPPRKGCDEATLTAIAEMAPRTVVMVSCNAATAARDAKWLTEHGYKAVEVQPVDLFPRTKHVEVIVCLSRDPGGSSNG